LRQNNVGFTLIALNTCIQEHDLILPTASEKPRASMKFFCSLALCSGSYYIFNTFTPPLVPDYLLSCF
jgi:hypothetical protein